MSNLSAPVPSGGVTDAENNLENKEVEGLSQGQIVRRRFFRNKLAVFGLFTLGFMFVLAFVGPYFSKHKWNELDFFYLHRIFELARGKLKPQLE